MNAIVTLSSKGQIVIPKDVRDALALHPGEKLTISHTGRRITLEASQPSRERIDYDEFCRRLPGYDGPTISIEDMDVAIANMWRVKAKRSG